MYRISSSLARIPLFRLMEVTLGTRPPATGAHPDTALWPEDVRIIIASLDEAPGTEVERRQARRVPYRSTAYLRLFSDAPGEPKWRLYTRDVGPRSLGFLIDRRLPVGHGGCVELLDPEGELISAECAIYRCREAVPGWYEGALTFNREQFSFAR
jgi:hypothetical protein